MAPFEKQLVVHRDLADLRPQPLDLLVAVVGRSALERGLALQWGVQRNSGAGDYTGNQTVYVTARASSGGSPTSNASVTFTMTKPNGTVVSQTAITDSTGSAVGKFRLKRQDPVGA